MTLSIVKIMMGFSSKIVQTKLCNRTRNKLIHFHLVTQYFAKIDPIQYLAVHKY